MDVVAPMPSPRETIAASVNDGLRSNMRHPNRMSCVTDSRWLPARDSRTACCTCVRPPISTSAVRCASSFDTPHATFSSASRATYDCSSSSSCLSTLFRRNKFRNRLLPHDQIDIRFSRQVAEKVLQRLALKRHDFSLADKLIEWTGLLTRNAAKHR